MKYVDLAIAVSFFLFFFAAVLMFSTNYFSNISSLTKTSEFRTVSENLFNLLIERKGVPENWDENYSIVPVKLGLMEDLYMVPVLVKETNGSDRTNEPVTINITFDENCQNKSWNTTVRMYDEDWNELNIEILNKTPFCTSQFLNETNITFEVNISANQTKKYYIYYSPDDGITDRSYTSLLYNTSSWIPSNRDEWTDNETTNFTHWSRYEGSSGDVTNDTVYKIRGNSSVNITGTFNTNSLGLQYDPAENITGVSNDWYLDVWLYLDITSQLTNFYVNISDSNDTSNFIYTDIKSSVTDATWYNLEKQLEPSLWTQSENFNASNGIDKITFYVTNSSSGLTRTIKVDGLYFKKKPLTVKTFPEERINAISSDKFNTLKNISYDESRKTIGENYKFKIEVGEDSYGGDINKSANVGCYESPKIIENKNGTISKVVAKMCVWK